MRERLGVHVHLADRQHMALAKNLGVNWVGVDLNFDQIHPEPHRWAWDAPDETITAARDLALHVYPRLAYAPPWSNGGQSRYHPPVEIHYWTEFVSEVGVRYRGQVEVFGAWNEPNRGFFAGTLEDYLTRILRPMAETLRAIDPNYKIAAPDLATEESWWEWFLPCLQQGREWIDIVTVHNYSNDNGREVLKRLGGQEAWGPPALWSSWNRPTVRQVMREAGVAEKPLALTEFGWSTARLSEAEQANAYDQFYEAMQTIDWLAAAVAFNLIDEPPTPDNPEGVHWGLYHATQTPKPAVAVIQRASGRPVG